MRTMVAVMAVGLAAGVALGAGYDEGTFARKSIPTYRIQTPKGEKMPVDTVIGEVRAYRIRKGDTLLDIARYFSLGYNEIVEANAWVDPWLPPTGATILLPTEWVLPCCTYEGIVLNIPEMRVFYYRPAGDGTTLVNTYPVGLGRDEWRTPSGRFRVSGKTVNPTWVIPESIRREHIAERGDDRTLIKGGDPENPLGKYRLELTLPGYRIHGTNIPWGVGMQVSHGCVRLYPEDIERLYPLVPVGTRGEFAYQLVKVGRRGGRVYVESHRDIYGETPAPYSAAVHALEQAGLATGVDRDLLVAALQDLSGIPQVVSRDPSAAPPAAVRGAGRQETQGDGVPDPYRAQARND